MEPNSSPGKAANPVTRFRKGVSYPFGALRVFREHTDLLKYAFIPFLINTVVYLLFIFLTIHYFADILHVARPDCVLVGSIACIESPPGTFHPMDIEFGVEFFFNVVGDSIDDNLVQATDLPLEAQIIATIPFRSDGPVIPKAIACSGEIVPTPCVRCSQIVLEVKSASYSSMRPGMASANSFRLFTQSSVTSCITPPTRV